MVFLSFLVHPVVSRDFYSPEFSESRFFRVQVFQGPGPGSGSKVRVQGLGSCFRSSRLSLLLTINLCYLQLIFICILSNKDTKINKFKKAKKYSEKNKFIKEK